MRISELLQKESIAIGKKPRNKNAAIDHLVELLAKSGNLKDKGKFKQAILEREKLSTTGIGEGIAIPHGKSSAVKKAALAAMVVPEGVDFESADGQDAHLLFMIAVPENGANFHLEVLERLAAMLMDEDFRKKLMEAKNPSAFLEIISREEEKRFEKPQEEEKYGYDVLAVTACPTGIAHTFMAAESLENKAREMGITIKVETNGSGGAKNVLTAEEIEEAKGIIVAADKNVEMARFNGKKVLQVPVADGIRKPDVLLSKIMQGEAPLFGAGKDVEMADGREEKGGTGKKIYRDLMNGVSHMLPFVIGGGILIALAFLLDDYSIDPANFGSNLPQAAFFKRIGDAAFGFMMPVLAGYIAMSIGDRPALAPGFVGGFLANSGGSGFLGALLAGFAGKCCPGLETARTGVRRLSFPQAVGETFGVFEMELAFRVVLGILAEAVLLAAVPSGLWQNALADPGSISFLESAAMGIFRHVCIPDDVSLAASLAAAGLRPGGVVLFLMMGVCTNLPELSVLWGMAGKKTAALYGGITAAGSVSLAALTELTIGKGFAPRFNLADAGMFTQLAGLLSIRTWIPARVPCALGVFVLSVCGFRNRMRNKA